MYPTLIRQFNRTLSNLEAILAKAEAHAAQHNLQSDVFLQARLAPDMFPLARQVQIACDAAKAAASAVAGQVAPRFADDETTLATLRERVAKTHAYIDGLDLTGPVSLDADRLVPAGYPPDKKLRLHDYVVVRQLPNFHFHVVTAYALLRHWGVPIGKGDYLGQLPLVDA
jgi:hypothetical protein